MLKPSMKRIGLTEVEYDWSLPDDSSDDLADTTETEAIYIDDFLDIRGLRG